MTVRHTCCGAIIANDNERTRPTGSSGLTIDRLGSIPSVSTFVGHTRAARNAWRMRLLYSYSARNKIAFSARGLGTIRYAHCRNTILHRSLNYNAQFANEVNSTKRMRNEMCCDAFSFLMTALRCHCRCPPKHQPTQPHPTSVGASAGARKGKRRWRTVPPL